MSLFLLLSVEQFPMPFFRGDGLAGKFPVLFRVICPLRDLPPCLPNLDRMRQVLPAFFSD